mgnify:FL=1
MIEIGPNLKEVLIAFSWAIGIIGAIWAFCRAT